jgi:hypothetical protein
MIEQYISKGLHEVEVWFEGDQVEFFLHANALQTRLGVTGGVCEIGVHHGRLFILLLLLRRAQERGVAIDVFDLQELNYDLSGAGNLARFKENVVKYAGSLDAVEIMIRDSLTVSAGELKANLGVTGRARLFSVDGSHTTYCTANDLSLAQSVVAPGGMIAVDDYSNPGFPMVAEGVARFMLLSPTISIVPFLAGANKVLFTTRSHHGTYLEHFRTLQLQDRSLVVREFYGVPCLCYN